MGDESQYRVLGSIWGIEISIDDGDQYELWTSV